MPEKKRDQIQRVVSRSLAAVCDVDADQLSGNTELVGDLRLDSLALYELVIELEEHYHLEISDEDIERVKTLDDVVTYIESKLKQERM